MYKISVPLINDLMQGKNREIYLEELKRSGASRVLLVPRGDREDLEDAKARCELLRENAELLRQNSIEPAIWVGTTIGHGGSLAGEGRLRSKGRYTLLVNLAGEPLGDTYCPFDESFRKMISTYVATLAKHSTIKLIFLDDDYRLSQHGKEFCCACEHHMARIRELCGEDISREELKKLAFESKPNKYREAWLTAQRESLEALAKDIRAEVDKVDENVCVALCAAHSIWGVDGSSATDISKILAGKNKPVTRLHPAPYWATHSTMPLPTVFEISRMFAYFGKDSGSELVGEGDMYPRPRYATPSSHLELFDAVLRADGSFDGDLKYMIDYCSPADYEMGYVKRHVRNLPAMEEISEIFDGKKCVGVYTPADKDVMHYADFEMGDAYRNNYPMPTAARMLSMLSIPTTFEKGGICAAIFGENARVAAPEDYDKGALLDSISARILTDAGVDVGLLPTESYRLVYSNTGLEHAADKSSYIIAGKRSDGRFMIGKLSDKCEILLEADVAGEERVPLVYRYENAAGQKFVVCMLDTMGVSNNSSVMRGYHVQKIMSEAVEWISGGEKLPAACEKNPDLYVLCKKNYDGKKMAVGLFNCYADSILEPVIKLDGEYKNARFVACSGTLNGDTVTLDAPINAFEFAAFEVEKE